MGPHAVPAPATGVVRVHVEHPTPSSPLPERALREGCDLDPIGDWIAELKKGKSPASTWPKLSRGLRVLLLSFHINRGRDGTPSAQTDPALDLQESMRRVLADDPAAPRSAIRVHNKKAGWAAAAQRRLADPETWLAPDAVAVVGANAAECHRIEALLRQPMGDGTGDGEPVPCDPLAEAQATAVRLYGADPAKLPKLILLASEIREGDSYAEVFLSSGCRGLSAEELLPAVRAARVGVHVVATGGEPASDGEFWPRGE